MAKPEARTEVRSAMAGVVVLVFVAVAMFVTSTAQSGHFLPAKTIKMAFGDIHTVQVNDDLRIFSMRVGRVSEIDYHDGEAIVTAELINAAPPIYKDASAQVLSVSPLALKYINLTPGTAQAGALGEGQIIPAAQNINSSDLQDVLEVLDPTTREQATSTVREVGFGLAGHGGDLHDFVGSAPDLLKNLGTTSGTLASKDFDFPGLMTSVDRLTQRLDSRQTQLRSLMDKAGVTMAALGVDHGQALQDTLKTAPPSLHDLRGALVSLKTPLADVQTTMQTIRPGAQDLGQTVPDLRGTFREGVTPLDKVPDVADKATPAVGDLKDTFSDLRPLAPKVEDAANYLETPLRVLGPYGPDIGQFFYRGHSFVSEGPAPNVRYARLDVAIGPQEATGGVFKSRYPRNEYPKPGQADKDQFHGPIPAGVVPDLRSRGGK
jgi:phospholipid/cholesterol/gamma-HCH transport system substrate-binding protein